MSDVKPARVPIVFISSTVKDLAVYRERVAGIARQMGFMPVLSEDFPASGRVPLAICLKRVVECDLLIVIVAHRYGFIPKEETEDRSITWLECLHAKERGIEVIAFLVEDGYDWPDPLKDEYALLEAVRKGELTPEATAQVQLKMRRSKDFQDWLRQEGEIRWFGTADDLAAQVGPALHEWLKDRPQFADVKLSGDPTRCLRTLLQETSLIEIRGLVGDATAKSFPIDELYIPLRSTGAMPDEEEKKEKKGERDLGREMPGRRLDLDSALREPRLVIVGDPGAGKTTFLRRVAQLACRAEIQGDAGEVKPLGFPEQLFPILVRLWELQQHIAACRGKNQGPAVTDDPLWLPHLLASQWGEGDSNLEEDFWTGKLRGGALLLLDGLDEAPSDRDRMALRRLIEKAVSRWPETRVVVTSRPAAYAGEAVLGGFSQARIDDLDDEAIEGFLSRWSAVLFPGAPDKANRQRDRILKSLALSPIRLLARNPVMLTALAVIHWNEKRLPEQRAELYESVLNWLARSRQDLPHRPSPESALSLLQALALHMQGVQEGRQIQIPRREAAESLASLFAEKTETERIAAAEHFLAQEENDSGIVTGRGNEVRFWHLTFQEYLVARALAGLPEAEQHRLVLPRLHQSEWREVVLLFFGVLHAQGAKKVDAFFKTILEELADQPRPAQAARCAGLLGSVLRDLAPLHYVAPDERYGRLLERVLGIFDKRKSKGVPIADAIEAAEALGQAGDPRFAPEHLGRNWVEIPAGEFRMGAQNKRPKGENFDRDAYDDEAPVRRVRLEAYRIGRYPVTVGEYARFVQEEGYARQELWQAGGFRQFHAPWDWESQIGHPTRPVVGVSWFEAAAYASWAGAALPTEAQWERAARGVEGRKFPWGEDEPSPRHLNFSGQVGKPTPVGVYPVGETPEGIRDLAGNVREWCVNVFASYGVEEERDSTDEARRKARSLRGGAWNNSAWYCRSSNRDGLQPDFRNVLIGFRVVFLGSQD